MDGLDLQTILQGVGFLVAMYAMYLSFLKDTL